MNVLGYEDINWGGSWLNWYGRPTLREYMALTIMIEFFTFVRLALNSETLCNVIVLNCRFTGTPEGLPKLELSKRLLVHFMKG